MSTVDSHEDLEGIDGLEDTGGPISWAALLSCPTKSDSSALNHLIYT